LALGAPQRSRSSQARQGRAFLLFIASVSESYKSDIAVL